MRVLILETIVPSEYVASNDKALTTSCINEGNEVTTKIPPALKGVRIMHKRLYSDTLSEDEIRRCQRCAVRIT